MKILDAGDHPLSNADVVDWIRRKRAQQAAEDAEDNGKGITPIPRPRNFMTALNRHERELTSDKYPYTKNPTAYRGKARETQFQKLVVEVENVVQDQLEAEWAERLTAMSKEQIEKEFVPLQEMKCLTEPEMLMIYNHAPTCVEMLQPMIENVEERFTPDEQLLLVEIIIKMLRPDERTDVSSGAS